MNQLTIVPGKTDAEIADDLKRRLVEIYVPVCQLLDDASSDGFLVQISTGPNAFGKHVITNLLIAKKF